MLEIICSRTNEFIQQMPKALRKKYGQFFTSKETARYMASLFCIPKNKSQISILANCVYPDIVYEALMQPFNRNEIVNTRFLGIQANTSPLFFSELDHSEDLKIIRANRIGRDYFKASEYKPI